MTLAPPPEPRDLLPPLLACLPTSLVSPRPPPALLPLLSPILRQRVNFLSSSTTDGWLQLLSWDTRRGAKLPQVVQNINLEPHPVSGELELDDVRPAKYRRLDEETLQSRLELEQFHLLPVYVWCQKDEHGGTNPGWKLAELRTLTDLEDGTDWFNTPSEADDAVRNRMRAADSQRQFDGQQEEDDTNDDYWAAYDRTPGETPLRTPAKRSPAPVPRSTFQTTSRAEDDYYARYGEEVQPALDSHDPDEVHEDVGQSTLSGETSTQQTPARTESADYYASLQPHSDWKADQQHDSGLASNDRSPEQSHDHLSMPRPISPTSSHSSVDRLEEQAADMSSEGRYNDQAQLAIKQHISTDVKSLFRLAKASGMDRAEFTRVVKRELEVLSLLDQDD